MIFFIKKEEKEERVSEKKRIFAKDYNKEYDFPQEANFLTKEINKDNNNH